MSQFFSRIKVLVGKTLYKLGIRRSPLLHHPTLQLHTEYLGTEYGGWTIFPDSLSPNSIVYSFGVGEDASFDQAIMQRYGVTLFAFDPTPRSIQWVAAQKWPPQFSFHPYGIAATDGTAKFYPPEKREHVSYSLLHRNKSSGDPITVQMLRLESISKMLGHTHIDLLKLDIEGAEYQVIPDILSSTNIGVDQILVEFHHHFPEVARADTRKAVEQLQRAGYELFNLSSSGNEYSFFRK